MAGSGSSAAGVQAQLTLLTPFGAQPLTSRSVVDRHGMDAPDLKSLLQHFDQKINRIEELVPWARTCTLLVQQHDARISGQDTGFATGTSRPLPDLRLLADMVMDMEESIHLIAGHLDEQRERLDKQRKRIANLIADLNTHLDYVSSNFPLNFGRSPEKPKHGRNTEPGHQKYGIHAASTKPAATVKNGVAGGRGGVNVALKTGTGPKSAAGRAGKPAGRSTGTKAPVAQKNDPPARKPVAAPAVLSGPAVVGSKSSKPAIPVRMTKKFVTRFNHNVNKN